MLENKFVLREQGPLRRVRQHSRTGHQPDFLRAIFKQRLGTTPTGFYRTAPTAVKKNAAMHQ